MYYVIFKRIKKRIIYCAENAQSYSQVVELGTANKHLSITNEVGSS